MGIEGCGQLIRKRQVLLLGFLSDLLSASEQTEHGNSTWMGARRVRGQKGLAAQAGREQPQRDHGLRPPDCQRGRSCLEPQDFPMGILSPRTGLRPLFYQPASFWAPSSPL